MIDHVKDPHSTTHHHPPPPTSTVAHRWAVHKSQGAEYPVVVLALFSQAYMLLRRQVLYTAVTRASRLLIIVGSRRAYSMAVRNDEMARRYGHFLCHLRKDSLTIWRSAAHSELEPK